ncbi:hypothetical protein BOX15_Mlig001976g2, partial [Macrostomum lignano]
TAEQSQLNQRQHLPDEAMLARVAALECRRRGEKVLLTRSMLHSLNADAASQRDNLLATLEVVDSRQEPSDASMLHSGRGDNADVFCTEMPQIACYNFMLYLFTICTYFLDIGSDIYLAIVYYRQSAMLHFTLTTVFVAVPSLVIAGFSLAWYFADHQRSPASRARWCFRLALHVLQLAPVLRVGECFAVAIGAIRKRRDDLYFQVLSNEADNAMLRMFEAFTESAPQLLLQLSIMLKSRAVTNSSSSSISTSAFNGEVTYNLASYVSFITDWSVTSTLQWRLQAVSSLISLFALSYAVCSYQSALRSGRIDKKKLSIPAFIVMLLWKLFIVFSRVMALSLTAATRPFLLIGFLACHYGLMLVWIMCQRTDFCNGKRFLEFCYNLVVSVVMCFDYFNVLEGRTRLKYIVYYSLVGVENFTLLGIWFFLRDESLAPFTYQFNVSLVLVSMGLGSFFVGLLFMALYYMCLHPSGRLRCCVSCKELSLCGHRSCKSRTDLTYNVSMQQTLNCHSNA